MNLCPLTDLVFTTPKSRPWLHRKERKTDKGIRDGGFRASPERSGRCEGKAKSGPPSLLTGDHATGDEGVRHDLFGLGVNATSTFRKLQDLFREPRAFH
jgi:hypothetical protein